MSELNELEKEVYDAVSKLEPIEAVRVAEATYDEDTHCSECQRPHLDYKAHEETVKETVLKLSDRGKIYPDANWNYRVRNE